jgi:hypothetical protein
VFSTAFNYDAIASFYTVANAISVLLLLYAITSAILRSLAALAIAVAAKRTAVFYKSDPAVAAVRSIA